MLLILGCLRSGCPSTDEEDPDADQDPAHDLKPGQRLREQDHCENRGDEGLEVRGERRLRGPDPVDRAEPEDVRQDERTEGREE